MNLSDFIHTNIKQELLDLGHSSAVATTCADSARAEYDSGSNWKMGAVYAELSKKAKKNAGKVKKKAGAKK
tara:strand:+ start:291 stop:503 length:213 start_codon:yes stop_codon:yes gene_type:complete